MSFPALEVNMSSFQFLGIPPKGELQNKSTAQGTLYPVGFQFLGIPPKGELNIVVLNSGHSLLMFPISRDPPEGGTSKVQPWLLEVLTSSFQFLGIPPKGEQ